MAAWVVTSAMDQLKVYEDRPALLHKGNCLTYGELSAAVYRTARALERRGLRRGDGLVLITGNRPEAFVIRFASYLLGLRLTTVLPEAEGLDHILTDAQPAAVITEDIDLGAGESAEPMEVRAREDDVARILYTGGTTGVPKGVPSSYAALGAATRAWSSETVIPEGTRFLLPTPFAHGSGDVAMNMLRLGAAVEILDGFDPAEFVAALDRATAAITYLYPSWLYRLLDQDADLGKLQFLAYGSAPIAPARLRQALDRLGPSLMQTYASTEAPAIAMLTPADHAAGRPELLASVGRPLPGVAVELRQPDGTAVPVGDVGEVCVRGASVMTGYWNRPELTADALRDGWLHTGDLGRFDADGYLYLVGRLKDVIIIDGHNHYSGPIEDVLTSHPAVRDAAVVGAPDTGSGESVHAFVVVQGDASDLHQWATERLTVPVTITLVDELPMTPLGKVDKKALRPGGHHRRHAT